MHANTFHLRLKINITIVPNQHMINKILKFAYIVLINLAYRIKIEFHVHVHVHVYVYFKL